MNKENICDNDQPEDVIEFLTTVRRMNKQFIKQIQGLLQEREEYRFVIQELQSQLQQKNEQLTMKEMIIQECELQLEACRANYEDRILQLEVQNKMSDIVSQVEINQLKQEMLDLSQKVKGYSTTAGTSFLQTSINQKQDSTFRYTDGLESVGQTEGEQSILENRRPSNCKRMMLKNLINDNHLKKQKDIVKREITQWQEDFFRKEGRPPTINDKQSISTKFYQYTILKKQLNDRSTYIQDSCESNKCVGVQCQILSQQTFISIQESLKWKTIEVRRLSYQIEDLKGKVRVYCRVRPAQGPQEVEFVDDTHISLKQKQFNFDMCFAPQSSQADVYGEIQSSLQAVFHGYNLCIFAYGQTGSGKTYTMFGTKQQPGVIPRLIEDIFTHIHKNALECSIVVNSLEIYKENIIDLLSEQVVPSLEIKEDGNQNVYVQNLSNIKITNANDLLNLIEFATSRRKQGHTEMNDTSSRSHMCTGLVIQTLNRVTQQRFVSRVNLIDLAGSERCNKSKSKCVDETKFINKSLSALNDVMLALSSKSTFIPYRNSKLTHLMKDCLGGNSKTIMIINVSPLITNADESLSSLQYGQRVKCITNCVAKNRINDESAQQKK